jgi:hypothetical protein
LPGSGRKSSSWIKILLKNPPFILREAQDERRDVEIIGDVPFMLSHVEACLGFFSRIDKRIRPFPSLPTCLLMAEGFSSLSARQLDSKTFSD